MVNKKIVVIISITIVVIVCILMGVGTYINKMDKNYTKGNTDEIIFHAEEYVAMYDSDSEYWSALGWKVQDNGTVTKYAMTTGREIIYTETWELTDEEYSRLRNILTRDFKKCDKFHGQAFDGVKWDMKYYGEIYDDGAHSYDDYIYDYPVLEEIESMLKKDI